MNILLDPVWPWSRLWDVLNAIPFAVRTFAFLAAIVCGYLTTMLFLRVPIRRAQMWIPALFAGAVLILFARHALGPAFSDARTLTSGSLVYLLAPLMVVALVGLLLTGPILAGLAVGGYLGVESNVSKRRRFIVLALRLLAFFLVFTALARPAFAWSERSEARSVLLLALDASRSMSIEDEESKARMAFALEQITKAKLDRLRDEAGIDVRAVRFADVVAELDLAKPGAPDGVRTDFAAMLRNLFDSRDVRVAPRALVVISDGADNGQGALLEAARWRNVAPIHTFSVGKTTTSLKQNDVALTTITTTPQPFVPMGGKLTVRVTVDARGYENRPVQLRLFIEDKDKADPKDKEKVTFRQVKAPVAKLPLTTGNEITLDMQAPDKPGEYAVRVTVEPDPPDDIKTNNTIETFVEVSKEGVTVLLVDRPRFESVALIDALRNARISVTPATIRGAGGKDVLKLDDQAYDVIILGDVTPAQLLALDPEALIKMERMVARGTGFLAIGGYSAFSPEWRGTPLEPVFPLDLSKQAQDDTALEMLPTEDGLRLVPYIMRLDDDKDGQAAWKKLNRGKLQGRSILHLPEKAGTTAILARTPGGDPLLVTSNYAKPLNKAAIARVMAFGGDTTNRWRRGEESVKLFQRFWSRLVLWLGRQEDAEGGVWVRPDATNRRIAVNSDLTFAVGLRGKGGGEVVEGTFEAEVTDPAGVKSRVPLSRSASETRGTFAGTRLPGMYRITARGKGKDASGGIIQGEASARMIIYDEDLEMSRAAADEDFLKKLATAGGGEARQIEEFADFVSRLREQPATRDSTRRYLRPEWRTTARSGFLTAFVVFFCAVACLEWGLRRLWGMV